MSVRQGCWAGLAWVVGMGWCGVTATGAFADAPAGRYGVAAETVSDNRTGLTWQRAVPGDNYPWAAAETYCNGLKLADFSDWRLPNKLELESLVDDTRFKPAIDPSAFPSTPSDGFWSASPYVGESGSAWFVHFGIGYSDNVGKGYAYRVRCVR